MLLLLLLPIRVLLALKTIPVDVTGLRERTSRAPATRADSIVVIVERVRV